MYHDTYKDKEYPPFAGLPEFIDAAVTLAYGKDSTPLKENRVSFFFFFFCLLLQGHVRLPDRHKT